MSSDSPPSERDAPEAPEAPEVPEAAPPPARRRWPAWSRAERVLERTPLRVKLIAVMLLLVTVTLALISLASVSALRGYLIGRLDDQIERVAVGFEHPPPGGFGGPAVGRPPPSPYLIQFRDANGQVVESFDNRLQQNRQPPRLPADPAELQARLGLPFTVPAAGGGGEWRVVLAPLNDGSGGTVAVATTLDDIGATIHRLVLIDLIASVGVLLVLAGVGVGIVGASLRPLVEIERTAGAIAAGDLTRRVPDRDPRTEVGRLGRALNSMLAQIEWAFRSRAASEAAARGSEERMRRFVADASHELRTPLTTIRGFAELYRQGAARDPEELDRLMRRIEDQAARMGLLVEDLLLLARLDQARPLDRGPVDLLAVAAEAVNDARAVAPDRRIELHAGPGPAPRDGERDGDGGEGAPPIVLGDEPRLRQVVANLMSNALTHTPAGTPIEVRAGTGDLHGGTWAVIEVTDHGPGLAPDQAERVFERFYRADPARSHDGGSGLGLAIVAALAAVHGGSAEVDSKRGRGTTFRVLLPLAPEVPSVRPPASP
jgi:two-component system OmpR family sensor kinase